MNKTDNKNANYLKEQTFLLLLRGVNVGGNNKIEMGQLKDCFFELGYLRVESFINSGNLVFNYNGDKKRSELEVEIEKIILEKFKFEIKALLLEKLTFDSIFYKIPKNWQNNDQEKTEIMFLWPQIDDENVVDSLIVKPGVDNLIYTPGALIVNIVRKFEYKSKLASLASTKTYKYMTVRNVNTVRKLKEILETLSTP